jgi:serine/threonine protein kinase
MAERWPPWADPRIAQILDHPNIVRLLDVVEASDHVAFVTEYVDGRGLHAAHRATGLDGTSFAFTHDWLVPHAVSSCPGKEP